MEEQSIKNLLIEKYNLKEKVIDYIFKIAEFYEYPKNNIENLVDDYYLSLEEIDKKSVKKVSVI